MYFLLLVAVLVHPGLAKHDSFIGFTAWKQEPQDTSLRDRILFEEVLINEGDAYEPALSQFTCPVSGVYYFSANLMADDSSILVTVVVGEEVLMYLSSRFSMSTNTASNSALVYCQSGDRIYLQSNCGGCRIYGEPGAPHTTFTVMLLSEQEVGSSKHSSLSGFSVGKIGNQTYENQDVIAYSIIIYTDGNWMENVHRYTCNNAGVYYINFNSFSWNDNILQLGVQKSTINYLLAQDVITSNYDNTISNSGLIYCETGETFVVKATGRGDVGLPTTFPNVYTTFNGFMLSNQNLEALHNGVLGFTVFKKGIQNYTAAETLTFEGILWDGNNTYDRVRNRFECIRNGVYYVSVTLKRYGFNPLYVQVEKESVPFLRSEEAYEYNPWNTISNSGLVTCVQGEEIKVVGTGTGSVYGDESQVITTFTLFLMHEY